MNIQTLSTEQVHQGNGHSTAPAPVADTPFYQTVENTEPPLRCRNCHNTDVARWELNQLRARWQCLSCQTLSMHNFQRVIVAATGEDAITEAVRFLDSLAARDVQVHYYENGKCGVAVPESWTGAQFEEVAQAVAVRDEVLRRCMPVRKGEPIYRKEPEQDTTISPEQVHQEPEHHTDALPAVDPQEQEPKPEHERKPWITVYADIRAGRAITEQGISLTFTPDCSLSQFLAQVTAEHRVYQSGVSLW